MAKLEAVKMSGGVCLNSLALQRPSVRIKLGDIGSHGTLFEKYD